MVTKMKPNFDFITDKKDARILIIGTDGSGKTVTMYHLAEKFHENNVKIYAIVPTKVAKHLPKWITPIGYKMPPNAMTLFDDAQLKAHAREWHKNITLDKVVTMARHRKAGVVVTTQETFRIDRNLIARFHFIIFKKPSIFGAKMERPEIRKLTQQVRDMFDELEESDPTLDSRQYSYVVCDMYEGFVGPTELPSFWKTEIGDW